MLSNTSSFVRVGDTLINLQTICAATLVRAEQLLLWFPGSSENDGPSFTINGRGAEELWSLLQRSSQSVYGSENSVG